MWIVFGKENRALASNIGKQMELASKMFAPALISFSPSIKWIDDPNFNGVYNPYDGTLFNEMKLAYAQDPQRMLNIFVPGGLKHDVSGFATFPHSPNTLEKNGGIVLDRASIHGHGHALVHQLGHAFGLYHTFEGSSKDKLEALDIPCDICAEFSNEPSDYKGDLCSDTPPTIEHHGCSDPTHHDCNDREYNSTDYSNPMSFSDNDCKASGKFTPQQIARMRCFLISTPTEKGLSSWLIRNGCEVNRDCDDKNLCTIDKCGNDGLCINEDIICPVGKACTESTCNLQTGKCEAHNKTCGHLIPREFRGCGAAYCNVTNSECTFNVSKCVANTKSDCCTTTTSPSCKDLSIASCVCQIQPSCCTKKWDHNCVLAVSSCGRDCLAEQLPFPDNVQCNSAVPVKLSDKIHYSKNSLSHYSSFTCFERKVNFTGVWYRYKAEKDTLVEINTCVSHNNIPTHAFVVESCPTRGCLAWGEGTDYCTNQAVTEFEGKKGKIYYIFIGADTLGTIAVRIDEPPARGFTPGEIAAMVIVPLAVVLLVVLLIIFAMKGKAESSEYYAMDYS